MADTLREFALTIKPFAQTHVTGLRLNPVYQLLHLHLAHHPGPILGNRVIQLLQAELDVVEIGDDLPYGRLQIRQQRLEITEGTPRIVGISRRDGLIGIAVGDKVHHTPILAVLKDVCLPCVGLKEMQHSTANILDALAFIFPADVARHGLDVVLQHLHIGEDGVVDALKHISRLAIHHNLKGVVDETIAQRQNVFDGFRVDEMPSDVGK